MVLVLTNYNLTTGSEARDLLEEFAIERDLDPLLPSTWYHLVNSHTELSSSKAICPLLLNMHALTYFLESTKSPFQIQQKPDEYCD